MNSNGIVIVVSSTRWRSVKIVAGGIPYRVKNNVFKNPWPQAWTNPTKIDVNKKWLPKQKTNQNINIGAKGSEKQEMKILPRGK